MVNGNLEIFVTYDQEDPRDGPGPEPNRTV